MKRSIPAILLLCLLGGLSCDQQPPLIPEPTQLQGTANTEAAIALSVVTDAAWPLDAEAQATIAGPAALSKSVGIMVRAHSATVVARNIVHYRFTVRVGPGPYDVIGLHRVVKQGNPCVPLKSKHAIFLLHGDAKDFTGMWLPGTRSTNLPEDFGLAAYLAEHNVDVWGIDQGWAIVPAGVTDFGFMKEWGLQRNINDLLFGISIARMARFLTGNGYDPMILLGYSSGGATGYAALGVETQKPSDQRQVRGFICADMVLKTNDPATRQSFVNDLAFYKDPYDNGINQADIPFQPIANLARTDPGGASPIFSGFTNMQVALFFGSGQIFGGDVTFHYLAGIMDETGFPVGPRFVTLPQWLDFMAAGVPYEANKFIIDYDELVGEVGNSPFDDHMAEIKTPIFNLAAKGGFGSITVYGTTLVGSSDITHLIAEMGTGDILTEFGHIDLFLAPQAPTKVWHPILKWVKTH